MSSKVHFDVAVIGAGPAGSLAAARLTRDGRSVLMLERAHFPRPAIGESLLPRCNDLLAEAGLLAPVEAHGFMRKHGALFLRGGQRARFTFSDALRGDCAYSFQVPRDSFDQLLAEQAVLSGAEARFGHAVTEVHFERDIVRLVLREGGRFTEVCARFVLDCSGPARVLSQFLGHNRPSSGPERLACFAQFRGDARPSSYEEGDIWVCCHPEGGWTWIIPFSDGRTSVGFVIDAARWDGLPGDDQSRLQGRLMSDPNVGGRLACGRQVMDARVLRAYNHESSQLVGDLYAIVGHSGRFIDPVLSSGVALSLEAAHCASKLVHLALAGEEVDWQREYVQPIARSASIFEAFVSGWYDGRLQSVFFSRSTPERTRRRITSILAGYTQRTDNPIANDPAGALNVLFRYCEGFGTTGGAQFADLARVGQGGGSQ